MQVYEEKDFIVIPMAMNTFYHNIPFGTKKIKYAQIVSIGEEFLELLIEYIENVPIGKYIVLDMESADYAFKLFEKFQNVSRPIILINIDVSLVYNKLIENLPELQFSESRNYAVLNISYNPKFEKDFSQKCEGAIHKIYMQIISEMIDVMDNTNGEPYKLDSSGLYSNMYVNTKGLFANPEKYYAILFGMARLIANSGLEFDGFVSSSKNGAILANLLGVMLGKKAIHISGLGPKYSMTMGNLQKEIKRKKNYIYIFDFRCTGTEMKILSALVKANDAYVVGALGIAVYSIENDEDSRTRIMYLANILDEGIKYKLAGEKEDIRKLIGGEVENV